MERKARRVVVFGEPEHVVLQALEVKLLIAEALVKIHARTVAGLFDRVAEGDGVFRELNGVHAVGARVSFDVLPVENDGVGEGVIFNLLEYVICLVDGLLLIERLREEVHAHVKACRARALDVLDKIVVRLNFALGVAAIAHADHGKLHAVCRDELPVDLLLMGRHVHADGGEGVFTFIALEAALFIKACRVVAVFRDGRLEVDRFDRRLLLNRVLSHGAAGIRTDPENERQRAPEHGGGQNDAQ